MESNHSNVAKYKWCAILVNCITMFVASMVSWISIPETMASLLGLGNDLLGFDKYLSGNLQSLNEALQKGKLTLFHIHKYLKVEAEMAVMSGEKGAQGDVWFARIFFGLILLFFAMEIIETLRYFFDKNKIFVGSIITSTILCGIVLAGTVVLNKDAGEDILSIDIGLCLSFMLPIVSTVLWHKHNKAVKEEETYAQQQGYNYTQTSQIAQQMENAFSSIVSNGAGKIGNVNWKDYLKRNARVIIFTAVALFLRYIIQLLGITIYSENVGVILEIVLCLLESVTIGLAVVYAISESYLYLVFFGVFGVVAKLLYYKDLLDYMSFGEKVGYIAYPLLIIAVLLVEMKYIQDQSNKLYIITGSVVVVKILIVSKILLNYLPATGLIMDLLGIIGIVYIFVKEPQTFEKFAKSTDPKIYRKLQNW